MYCLIRDNSDNSGNYNNFYQGQQELAFEIEKLKQSLSHKDEIISRLENELATLKQVIGLLPAQS